MCSSIFNAILQRLDDARSRGVVTHSSGNHARAVAWVARELGLRATIVIPDAAPAVKVDAVRRLGAEVVIVAPEDRDTRAFELAAEHGYVMIPPYDDAAIVAGQGTIGLEIAADLASLAGVLVPVSGGGLIAGIAAAVKAVRPQARIVGVEPELAADARESLRAGRRIAWDPQQTQRTIADALRVEQVGELTFEHIRRYVDEIVTVTEEEIRIAVRRLACEARLVSEPGGAVAVAACLLRAGELPAAAAPVAVLSGGNIEPALLAAILGDAVSEPAARKPAARAS